jgi:hypothetical protein
MTDHEENHAALREAADVLTAKIKAFEQWLNRRPFRAEASTKPKDVGGYTIALSHQKLMGGELALHVVRKLPSQSVGELFLLRDAAVLLKAQSVYLMEELVAAIDAKRDRTHEYVLKANGHMSALALHLRIPLSGQEEEAASESLK